MYETFRIYETQRFLQCPLTPFNRLPTAMLNPGATILPSSKKKKMDRWGIQQKMVTIIIFG
jgi:hypothetical protein